MLHLNLFQYSLINFQIEEKTINRNKYTENSSIILITL